MNINGSIFFRRKDIQVNFLFFQRIGPKRRLNKNALLNHIPAYFQSRSTKYGYVKIEVNKNQQPKQMKSSKILPRDFYNRPVLKVARELLGMRLVRIRDGQRIAGIILETEGYDGESDLACHAHVGRTKRNEVMFGAPGHAYVYFTYGMHWLLNCVTGRKDYPAAVLIRAIQPVEGIQLIAKNRLPAREKDWCNGPAKLAKALEIDKALNGVDLCSPKSQLFIEEDRPVKDENVKILTRVGINAVPEPWRSKPWRFLAQ